MIKSSVGTKGVNQPEDVRTIQRTLNLRNDLIASDLTVDGLMGENTQAAIDHVQNHFKNNGDGLIHPYGSTLKKLWRVAYANPTGLGVRGTDAYGAGHYGASRGSRTHDGVDYQAKAGQPVKAPMSGKVTRISRPYASGIDASVLSGVEILASDGTTCWVWYMQPSPNIVGRIVRAGSSVIGKAKTLKNRYKNGITDHVHIRIHTRQGRTVDPSSVIK